MRIIKFRAFAKEEKTFIYSSDGTGGWWGDCVVDMLDDYEPIQQYTGLHDMNDVEIYEGDIVKFVSIATMPEDIQSAITDIVVWNPKRACWQLGGYTLRDVWPETFEVVGNIYKNQELLKT